MCIEMLFLFDFDGMFVDSVYQYVFVWKEVFDVEGIELFVWCIYCKIGMSGGLFLNQLLCEMVGDIDVECVEWFVWLYVVVYQWLCVQVWLLFGVCELLVVLLNVGICWVIVISGWMEMVVINFEVFGVDLVKNVVVMCDQVKYVKLDLDLFLIVVVKLNVLIEYMVVVGDSIWDMFVVSCCCVFGVGLLVGGYGSDELECVGVLCVYDDLVDLLWYLDEVVVWLQVLYCLFDQYCLDF